MKIMTISALLVSAFLLSGCNQEPNNGPDQCLRQEIFKQCLANIPKGPTHLTAAGNDWDEVVSQCDSAAYYQSMRIKSTIKPECRAS